MLDFELASEREVRAELCQRLRTQRLGQALSQADLAERAGISLSTVKLIENTAQCTLENFMRLVLGLGLAGELQALFVFKPKSIAQMVQAEQAQRMRAPRKTHTPPQPPQTPASADADAPRNASTSRLRHENT